MEFELAEEQDNDDFDTEDELDEVPYVEFDISVSPSDPTLELLANQIARNDIIIPFYQRRYVWKIEQASRLVESFLMGLPVPQVFLYVNNEDQLEVIDGQQRLLSVKYFLDGFFGEEDNKGRRQVFKLKGLAERSEHNGKSFAELPPRDQRKIRNSTLRTINIKQIKPTESSESVFHIFQRLNTGGTRLKPQEIRNAVYRGNIVDELRSLNKIPEWQNILGLSRPDKSQKDVELVLRLFSLYKSWSSYEKPMLTYLNNFMGLNKSFDSTKAKEFKQQFPVAVKFVNENLVRPFRPKGVVNSAVLEAVMISVMENPKLSGEKLKSSYASLLKDGEFQSNVTGGTTDTAVLQNRIRRAKAFLA